MSIFFGPSKGTAILILSSLAMNCFTVAVKSSSKQKPATISNVALDNTIHNNAIHNIREAEPIVSVDPKLVVSNTGLVIRTSRPSYRQQTARHLSKFQKPHTVHEARLLLSSIDMSAFKNIGDGKQLRRRSTKRGSRNSRCLKDGKRRLFEGKSQAPAEVVKTTVYKQC
ncbi:hypothetical protein C8J56DRAFT_394463 [Mycena floridula]|nr:hypothetical protein C8J56DRAFT_394463 [Mycena floridula]